MIDLERAVGGANGIPELYEFVQTLQHAIIKFAAVSNQKPQILINQQDTSVYVHNSDDTVVLSGHTYGRFYKYEATCSNNVYTIKLYKEEMKQWPILIVSPSAHGIDKKSLYLIGVYNDSRGKYKEAYENYYTSAQKGFVTAITTVADILMSDFNNYEVKKDIDAALQLLRTIKPADRSAEVTQTIANIYLDNKNKEEAVKIYKEHLQAQENLVIRYDLVKQQSSILGGIGPQNEAVDSLEILVESGNPEAMQLLAQHLYKGIGTKEDRQRAFDLDIRACEINPTLNRLYGNMGIYHNIAIASATTCAFAGMVYFIWSKVHH